MNASSYSPEKSTWLNPNIEYIFNTGIVEYDIHSAGLSLIKKYHLLEPAEILRLESMNKTEQVVAIGKIQRDREGFSKVLLEKFTEARAEFISANRLTDERIISVKKDAIFTIGACSETDFGDVKFVEKHAYSSYVRFTANSNIEIYYSGDRIDVKGIGDGSLPRHRLYMLDFIRRTIQMIEVRDRSIRRHLRNFVDEYREGKLDEGYYLEFNNLSQTINAPFNFTKVVVPFIQIVLQEIEQ